MLELKGLPGEEARMHMENEWISNEAKETVATALKRCGALLLWLVAVAVASILLTPAGSVDRAIALGFGLGAGPAWFLAHIYYTEIR